MKHKQLLFLILFFWGSFIESKCYKLPPLGVSPLFSFGHSILGKGRRALNQTFAYSHGKIHSTYLSVTSFYYGVTNPFTFIIDFPVIHEKPLVERPHDKSTGLGDMSLRLNYLLYQDETLDYRFRLVPVAGVRFPTATITTRTLRSLKATNFFIGLAKDALTPAWYIFSDAGINIMTKKNNRKEGNLLVYDIGIGRTLCWQETYLTLFIEMNCIHQRPNEINGALDLRTGGMLLFLGPTYRLRYKAFLFQGGIQGVISRHTRVEDPNATSYVTAFSLAYIF